MDILKTSYRVSLTSLSCSHLCRKGDCVCVLSSKLKPETLLMQDEISEDEWKLVLKLQKLFKIL